MTKKTERTPLSEAQMEIMQCVWELGEATVTNVWQSLPDGRKIARNTVLTVMDRLVKRDWLTKHPIGNTHLYKATIRQEQALGGVVKRLVETTFSGSADRLVMALLDGRGISADEAARIRLLIKESRDTKTKRKK